MNGGASDTLTKTLDMVMTVAEKGEDGRSAMPMLQS